VKMSRRKFLTSSSESEPETEPDSEPIPVRSIPQVPRVLYTPNGDQILELSIETLMGTTFEVRVPAKTLVSSIKGRLQRSEGIPRHHLHLIHAGKSKNNNLINYI
jgi:hypothetical protein